MYTVCVFGGYLLKSKTRARDRFFDNENKKNLTVVRNNLCNEIHCIEPLQISLVTSFTSSYNFSRCIPRNLHIEHIIHTASLLHFIYLYTPRFTQGLEK